MTRFIQYVLSVLLLFALWLPTASATPALILTDAKAEQQRPLHLLDNAEILQDPEGKLTLQDVLGGKADFHPVQVHNGKLDFFLTQSAYWLRMDIRNLSDKQVWYFSMSGSLSRQLEVYLSAEDGKEPFTKLHLLDNAHFNQYLLSMHTGQLYQLYLRVQDRQAPLLVEPLLFSPQQMLTEVMLTYPLYSFVIGGLLTLSLYNLLYFFYLRDRSFLALSIFILGFVLEMGNHSGLWHYFSVFRQYLAPLGNTFGFLTIIAGISLASNWLEVRQYLPRAAQWFRIASWAALLLIPVHWLVGYGTVFAGGLGLLTMALFTGITLIRRQQGFHFPFMLRTGILLVLFSFFPTMLRGIGIIGDIPMLTDSMYFTLLVALVMLSLTQAEQVRMKSEQAERIAAANQAKDEFLTTMSHELRTPMNAVVNAGRLLKLTPLSSIQNEYVARLSTSAQHMLALINNILDLARLDSSLMRMEDIPFRLTDVLQQTEQLLVEQARNKQLTLTLFNRFHPLKKQLAGDPTRLQQVLLNLLNNAIKFTQTGGVSLTVTPQEVGSENARLLFEVHDTGIGIAKADRQKLFQPFFQVDGSTARQYAGSGLGLAISYKLVRRMGGELKVESRPGHGSRFFFSLNFPLCEQQTDTSADTAMVSQPSLSNELRILLVDDDEMNRFFGSELIRSLGVQVEVADCGEKVIQIVQEQGFDVVFMDVGMPDMDGYETTRRIRSQGCQSPVVALTAHAVAGERERCLASGMDDYLTKPFEIEQLEKAIWRWSQKTALGKGF